MLAFEGGKPPLDGREPFLDGGRRIAAEDASALDGPMHAVHALTQACEAVGHLGAQARHIRTRFLALAADVLPQP